MEPTPRRHRSAPGDGEEMEQGLEGAGQHHPGLEKWERPIGDQLTSHSSLGSAIIHIVKTESAEPAVAGGGQGGTQTTPVQRTD